MDNQASAMDSKKRRRSSSSEDQSSGSLQSKLLEYENQQSISKIKEKDKLVARLEKDLAARDEIIGKNMKIPVYLQETAGSLSLKGQLFLSDLPTYMCPMGVLVASLKNFQGLFK